MNYQNILFDLDGTLMNTVEDIRDAVNHTFGELSLPAITSEQTAQALGNGTRMLLTKLMPESVKEDTAQFEELIQKALDIYLPYYKEHSLVKTAPYPGISDLVGRCEAEHIRMAIISNKPDRMTKDIRDRFFPGMYAVGEREGIRKKPAPDAIWAVMEELGMERSATVYIGDTEVDLRTAENAGIDCIAVSWGFRTKEQLLAAGADEEKIADTAAQLDRLL